MSNKIKTSVFSEIGDLEGVILHKPGTEVRNMTPENAERALYSDILNLSVASNEYYQFSTVLDRITTTYQVQDLLAEILKKDAVKRDLLAKICFKENLPEVHEYLLDQPASEIARQLIEGVEMEKNTYTKFMDSGRHSMRPLHNFFFMRDASMTVRNKVLVGRMASSVRDRESCIMEAIFDHHPMLESTTVNPVNQEHFDPKISIEGGDVLVARDDILVIGNGSRTSTQGIDFIVDAIKATKEKRHIIVQELPDTPESFIHLDMVFTFLDVDKCMVFEPVIMQANRFRTVQIDIDNGEVKSIHYEDGILPALKKLGMDLKPIYCGGTYDHWTQEREQWHSGANFFALGPGKIIGYGRNTSTIEELNKNGFEVLPSSDIIDGHVNPADYQKYVITIPGSELARGGGGCRCMTMPIVRKPVQW